MNFSHLKSWSAHKFQNKLWFPSLAIFNVSILLYHSLSNFFPPTIEEKICPINGENSILDHVFDVISNFVPFQKQSNWVSKKERARQKQKK